MVTLLQTMAKEQKPLFRKVKKSIRKTRKENAKLLLSMKLLPQEKLSIHKVIQPNHQGMLMTNSRIRLWSQ